MWTASCLAWGVLVMAGTLYRTARGQVTFEEVGDVDKILEPEGHLGTPGQDILPFDRVSEYNIHFYYY